MKARLVSALALALALVAGSGAFCACATQTIVTDPALDDDAGSGAGDDEGGALGLDDGGATTDARGGRDGSAGDADVPYDGGPACTGRCIDHAVVQWDETCAVYNDHSFVCWGSNGFGELGRAGTVDNEPHGDPEPVDGVPTAEDVSVGWGFVCARRADGGASCWGDDEEREMGQTLPAGADRTGTAVALPAPPLAQIAAGKWYALGLETDGGVLGWGNGGGTLGPNVDDAGTLAAPSPVFAFAAPGPKKLWAGFYQACATMSDDSVQCWGWDAGSNTTWTTPRTMSGVTAPSQIVFGEDFTCALQANGRVVCWGLDTGFAGAGLSLSFPTGVVSFAGSLEIAAGQDFLCALGGDHLVRCAGGNGYGQLGRGNVGGGTQNVPAVVSGLPANVDHVYAGGFTACALTHDGALYCWGDDSKGQVTSAGAGPGSNVPTATAIVF